jgi:guanosine-3',5'-bis(diphosphate) 3'-pyrophosphohydrolase
MTQSLYQQAIKFAGEKHADQKVPSSNSNYVVHLSNVAMEVIMAHKAEANFDLDLAVQIALLHDSLEDTNATFEKVESLFGIDVARGVQALTKDPNLSTKSEKMADSLRRINEQSKEVVAVKLADRITNLQEPPASWDQVKKAAYLEEAKLIATSLAGKNKFLDARIAACISAYIQYMTE